MKKTAKKRSELEKALVNLIKDWELDLKEDVTNAAKAKTSALYELKSESTASAVEHWLQKEFSLGCEVGRRDCISDLRSLLKEGWENRTAKRSE